MSLTEAQQEAWAERAAIMEFDGGLDRKTAERMASISMLNGGKGQAQQDKAAAAIALMREMVR